MPIFRVETKLAYASPAHCVLLLGTVKPGIKDGNNGGGQALRYAEEQSREGMGPRLSLTFDSTKVTVYCMAAWYMFFGQLPQQVLFRYLHLSRMLRAGERGSTYMPNKIQQSSVLRQSENSAWSTEIFV